MARPIKSTIEYFPHFVKGGKTLYILESKFGNDGYAFWFKLLEILCDSDKQVYDCSTPSNWGYLLAKCRCCDEQAEAILSELTAIGKVDKALWEEKRIIWVQTLVDNLEPIYRKRRDVTPTKDSFYSGNPDSEQFPPLKPEEISVSAAETPQRREEKSKVKKSISIPYEAIVELWNSTCVSFPKVVKLTDGRRTKIKSRLAEMTPDPEQYLAVTGELFKRVQASAFLRGDNNHAWQANFDWLFDNGANWVKVQEGNYDNKGGYRPAQQRQNSPLGITLGIGEYLDENGRRTYGSGAATIPPTAPPRPSERHYWNSSNSQWVL